MFCQRFNIRPWTILTSPCPGPLSAPGKTRRIIANLRGSVNRSTAAFLLLVFLWTGLAAAAPSREKRFGPCSEAEVLEILHKAYADWQGDRTEKLALLIDDGQAFTSAGSNPNGPSVSLVEIIRTLARKENGIWQVGDIFHNHNNPRDGFSQTDPALFETLRKAGIKGRLPYLLSGDPEDPNAHLSDVDRPAESHPSGSGRPGLALLVGHIGTLMRHPLTVGHANLIY
jgi:hypothetical protein